ELPIIDSWQFNNTAVQGFNSGILLIRNYVYAFAAGGSQYIRTRTEPSKIQRLNYRRVLIADKIHGNSIAGFKGIDYVKREHRLRLAAHNDSTSEFFNNG